MRTEAERLRELLAINRAITGTVGYEAVLALVVEKARAFTDSSACVLLLAEPGAPAAVAASVGVAREVARDFRAVLDERIGAALRDALALGPDAAIVAVPMILRGNLRGILAVVEQRDDTDAEIDEFLLSALADQAAIALGTAAHLKELEAALAIADRERTARKAALDALAEERTWLRAVIQHAPVAVILVQGASGERVTANARAEELFGRAIVSEAGLAQYAGQYMTADGAPLPNDEIPAIAALRGEVVHRELAVKQASGTVAPVLASAAAIRGGRDDVLGAVVLLEDISMLKNLQRLREEWTSIVAHDLRQPLSAIKFRAQRLARANTAAKDEGRRTAQDILSSVERLNRMIRDLLDVSLLSAKHLTVKRRPTAVRPMVASIVERFALGAEHRIDVVAPEESLEVDADEGRVEQVLVNLLTNAVKYGDRDAPVEVRVQRRDGTAEIVVINRGPGMSRETIAGLFARFQRGDGASFGDGLGLGLYISKGIVEAHGGTIWVESTPRETTAFHFTLPIAVAEGRD